MTLGGVRSRLRSRAVRESEEYKGRELPPQFAIQLKESSLRIAKLTEGIYPDLEERGIEALERLERFSIWALKEFVTDCQLLWVKKWQDWWESIVAPFDNDERTAAEKLVAYVAERKNGFIKETPEIQRFEKYFSSKYRHRLMCTLDIDDAEQLFQIILSDEGL